MQKIQNLMQMFASRKLFDFLLEDRSGMPQLAVRDGPGGQTLHLKLRNTAGESLHLSTLEPNQGFHFRLRFRPGTLAPHALQHAQMRSVHGWTMRTTEEAGFNSFDFVHNGTLTIPAGQSLDFPIVHVLAEGRLGSHYTEVELCVDNLTNDAAVPVLSHLITPLHIVEEKGSRQSPFQFGCVNGERVLNDGQTANEVTLCLGNRLPYNPTHPQLAHIHFSGKYTLAPARLLLQLELQGPLEEEEFGLCRRDAANNIGVVVEHSLGSQSRRRRPLDFDWSISKDDSGNQPLWILQPEESFDLLPGEHLHITLTNLQTNLQPGQSHVFLRHENIRRYWDETLVITLTKTPLYIKHDPAGPDRVGIGTNAPQATLDVRGSLDVSGKTTFRSSLKVEAITDHISLNASGGVGIQTNSPRARVHIHNLDASVPTLLLQGGDAEGDGDILKPRPGLAFSYFDKECARHFITTNHSNQPAKNNIAFWINNQSDFEKRNTPGDGAMRVMTLRGDGNVGIGTHAPVKGKLHIEGFVSHDGGNFFFFTRPRDRVAATGDGAHFDAPYSIWASDRIGAAEFNAFSDARIKKIIGVSDAASDLNTLMQIEVTDYRLKDDDGDSQRLRKKAIGQQVEQVFPQAVSRCTNTIPDIFTKAQVENGWIKAETDLQPGERVRIIAPENEAITVVLEVKRGAFRTEFQPQSHEVFIYGREVADFRTVDYESLAMLNLSATQQMKREKDAEIAQLQHRCEALEAAVAALVSRSVRSEGGDHAG